MPVADTGSGRLFIWLITFSMFLCTALGVAFLVAYVVLPSDPSRSWLTVAGFVLAGIPWGFWLLTCFYRILSRALGFRFLIGGGHPANAATSDQAGNNHKSLSPGSGQEGAAEEGQLDHDERRMDGGNAAAAFRDDMSVASHESEMHLASSMVS